MAKIVIECADPNDFAAIVKAAEKAAGRCDVTYAKQAAALVEAGTVASEHAAAKQIAEETGEIFSTVRKKISRGKSKVAHAVSTPATTENDTEKEDTQTKKDTQRPLCVCGKPAKKTAKRKDGSTKYTRLCSTCQRKKGKNKQGQQAPAVETPDTESIDEQRKLWNQVTLKLKNINSIIKKQIDLPPLAALNKEEVKALASECERFGLLMQYYEEIRICIKP